MDVRSNDQTWEQTHHALVPLMRVDNFTNIAYIAREYLGLSLTLGCCAFLLQSYRSGQISLLAMIPLAIVGMATIAAFQHRLSGLAHDASHYTLFKNKLVNELASDLLLMFPIVAMTQKYRTAHLGHHQHVNDPLRDPDLIRLNHPVAQKFPISKATFWMRYVLKSLWPPATLGYLFGRAKAANMDSGTEAKPIRTVYRMKVARSIRGAYWLSLLATVQILQAWPLFWLFWVTPLLTFYPLFMLLREIAHHSNAPDDGDFTNSRVFQVHPLLEAVVFPYGQAFHLTHHLFAMIPHFRSSQAHDILMNYALYRENVIVCRGYFFRTIGTDGPSVLDVLEHGLKRSKSNMIMHPPHPGGTERGSTTPPHRVNSEL
jgi:fatty acid desaturase